MHRRRPRPLVTRPTVSVVIPCYNYGRYLPAAIGAALDQDGVDVEVVVVDDASTDDSASVAEAFATDPRVRLLRHATNRGHIATYNDGLRAATGDYLALVSADDLLARDALTRAVALMERHRDVGLVYGYARSFSGTVPEQVASAARVRSWSVYEPGEWLRLAARRGRCFVVSPEAVLRREAWHDAGEYDARLPHSADFALWLATAAGWGVGRVNGPAQAHYRVHAQNMHLTAYAGWLTDLEARRETFELFFAERSGAFDVPERLHDVARRALAREALRRAVTPSRDADVGADRYLAFAERVDPELSSGLRGRLARRLVARPVVEPVGAAWRFVDRVEHHLRWRYERRYGT